MYSHFIKNRLFSIFVVIVVAGACCLFGESGRAAEDIFLTLKDKSEYGSGPSVMDNLYSPGGLEGVGLFIGHPNNLNRRDRVLLKFNLSSLLLMAERIESATLTVTVDYFSGEEDAVQLDVGHFEGQVDALSGQELNREDVETVTTLEVTKDDAINGEGVVRSVPPLEVDVTAAILADLSQGQVNAVFRLSAPEIEMKPTMESHGLVLARGEATLPVLRVTLRE